MWNTFVATFFFLFTLANHPSDGGAVTEPSFTQPLENVTVSVGRDALFTCHVRGLGTFGVGWVKADTKAILSIHNRIVTHNPRVAVSHSGHSEWNLHIKSVKVEDRGAYMCQINTDPMISLIAYLQVVIPPDFVLEGTTGDVMVSEGGTVRLTCNATGQPTPAIHWKRENNQNITLKTQQGAKTYVKTFEGNTLQLNKVTRSDMGPYFCIASNGVPPAISKRIMVSVHFHPGIHVPNQLVAAPIGAANVTLECNVEAYPRAIHFWTKNDGSSMIISTGRYEVRDVLKSIYEVTMILTIHKFRPSDAGEYKCKAKNSLGDSESKVRVHALNVDDDRSGGGQKTHKPYEMAFDEDEYDTDYGEISPGTVRPSKNSKNDVLSPSGNGRGGGRYNNKHGGGSQHNGRGGENFHLHPNSTRSKTNSYGLGSIDIGSGGSRDGRIKNVHHPPYTPLNNNHGSGTNLQNVPVPVIPGTPSSDNSFSSTSSNFYKNPIIVFIFTLQNFLRVFP